MEESITLNLALANIFTGEGGLYLGSLIALALGMFLLGRKR